MESRGPSYARSAKYVWRPRSAPHGRPDLAPNSLDVPLDPGAFVALRTLRLTGDASPEPTAAHKSLLSLLPNHTSLKDVDKSVERILQAMRAGQRITIFGDYDVDGTTSCAMMRRFFDEIGYPVDIYIPERLVEGYGLNPTGLRKVKDAGADLVITVDNGIAAVDACAVAKSLGLDVIITDHHDLPPSLPDAFAILNPKQPDCAFPFKMLAGVGVAFYLLAALRAALRASDPARYGNINMRRYLDYVALGTIADLAPLDGVNHVLCKVGLEVMFDHVVDGSLPGVARLLTLAGWKMDAGVIDASDVGFKIGPRLNAAGRLGNALATEELLSTRDTTRAHALADFLHAENAERQALEKEMTAEAHAKVLETGEVPAALVLHEPHWHTGVVGLVASRVLERYYRPTLALGTLDGKIKGSGRSTHAFDLFAALNEVRDEFISFGGHFHAVGLTLAPEKLPWLQEYLARKARERIDTADMLHPLDIDGLMDLSKLDADFLERLERFEPYGIENPRPKWLIRRAKIRHVKRIGKAPDSNHARVTLADRSGQGQLTAFDMASQLEKVFAENRVVDVVVEGRLSYWNGSKRPELRLIDFLPIEPPRPQTEMHDDTTAVWHP